MPTSRMGALPGIFDFHPLAAGRESLHLYGSLGQKASRRLVGSTTVGIRASAPSTFLSADASFL